MYEVVQGNQFGQLFTKKLYSNNKFGQLFPQNIKFNSSTVILKIQLTTVYRKMHTWEDEGNMQFNLYLTWIPFLILLHNCYTIHYSHHKIFLCRVFTNHHCHILRLTNFLIFNI